MFNLYEAEYLSGGGKEDDIQSYTPQTLIKKVKDKLPDKICVKAFNKHQGNLIYSSALSGLDARASFDSRQGNSKFQNMIQSVALRLRSQILALPKWKTPVPTTVHNLKAISTDIPEEFKMFYETLLCGLRNPTGEENKQNIKRGDGNVLRCCLQYIKRLRETLETYSTVLGLGLGSRTSSKLVLGIFNRLGSSLSYNEVKALETEFAFSIAEDGQDTPDGMKLDRSLVTSLGWDNYDVNMETIDGSNTLHATLGICSQNESQTDESGTDRYRQGRNRRHFDGTSWDIALYHCGIRMYIS